MAAALPVHGLPDEAARRIRYVVRPEYRSLWNFRTGRPYVSNRAPQRPAPDPGDRARLVGAESVVLVPDDLGGRGARPHRRRQQARRLHRADVQLLSIFAGPGGLLPAQPADLRPAAPPRRAARARGRAGGRHGGGGRAAPRSSSSRSRASSADLGYDRVAFHAADGERSCALEAEAGEPRPSAPAPPDAELLRLGAARRDARCRRSGSRTASRAGGARARGRPGPGRARGACAVAGGAFADEELNLLSALAGQLAVALQNRPRAGPRPSGWPRQMATLYDLALETTALRDLRPLFTRRPRRRGG